MLSVSVSITEVRGNRNKIKIEQIDSIIKNIKDLYYYILFVKLKKSNSLLYEDLINKNRFKLVFKIKLDSPSFH